MIEPLFVSEILPHHKCYFLIHSFSGNAVCWIYLLALRFHLLIVESLLFAFKSIASLTCVSASGDRARCFGIRSNNSFVKVWL